MIKGSHSFYQQLLDLNEEAFSRHLFTVAYHALSAALYCGIDLGDASMLECVEKRTLEQLNFLKVLFASHPTLGEPLEITLYTSLLRIANPRHNIFRDGIG